MEKKSGTGINRLINALGWSLAGIKSAFKHEKAFRQETVLFILLAPVGIWFGQSGIARALLLGSLLLVMIVELLNSGIEAVVDRIGEEHHHLAGRAKDFGSAAVFLSLINAAFVWFFVLTC